MNIRKLPRGATSFWAARAGGQGVRHYLTQSEHSIPLNVYHDNSAIDAQQTNPNSAMTMFNRVRCSTKPQRSIEAHTMIPVKTNQKIGLPNSSMRKTFWVHSGRS